MIGRRKLIKTIGGTTAIGAMSATASATTSGTIDVSVGSIRNPISYTIELDTGRFISSDLGQGGNTTHSVANDALVERVSVESSGGAWLLQPATFSFDTDPGITETRFELTGTGGEGYRVYYSDAVVNDSVDNIEKAISDGEAYFGDIGSPVDSDTLLGKGSLTKLECNFNHGELVYERL